VWGAFSARALLAADELADLVADQAGVGAELLLSELGDALEGAVHDPALRLVGGAQGREGVNAAQDQRRRQVGDVGG
jgi:hypothetical protein